MRDFNQSNTSRFHHHAGLLAFAILSSLLLSTAATAQLTGPDDKLTTGGDNTNELCRTSAVWRDGGEDDQLVWTLSEGAFKNRARALGRRGFELIDVESQPLEDSQRYSGLWRRQTDETRFFLGLTRAGIRSTMRRQSRRGFQLIDIEPWSNGGRSPRYDAIFAARRGNHQLELNLSLQEIQARHTEFSSQGLHILDLETRSSPGGTRSYSAIWHPGQGEQRVQFDLSKKSFESHQAAADRDGLMLDDIEVFFNQSNTGSNFANRNRLPVNNVIGVEGVNDQDGPSPRFAAIWNQRTGSYWLLTEATKKMVIDRRQQFRQEGSDLFLIDFEVRCMETSGTPNQQAPVHNVGTSVPTPPPDNSGD